MSNIVADVHADIDAAIRHLEQGVSVLRARFAQLVGTAEQAGTDLAHEAETQAQPLIHDAEHDAAKLAATAAAAVAQVAASELPKA